MIYVAYDSLRSNVPECAAGIQGKYTITQILGD